MFPGGPHLDFPFSLTEECSCSTNFLTELHRFNRAWDCISGELPLKKGEFMLMNLVDFLNKQEGKKATVSAIADFMHLTPAAISQKISGMDKAGYIKREEDPNDRRVIFLELSEKGNAERERCINLFVKQTEKAIDIVGEEKINQVIKQMHEIVEILNAYENEK